MNILMDIAYAMSGGTAAHSLLGVTIVGLLDEQLRSGPCRVFNSNMRVQLSDKTATSTWMPLSVVMWPIARKTMR